LKLIRELSPISKIRNDIARVELFERTRVSLEKSIEHEAWDGKWYRRAFMDSGLMLGSRRVKEFRIDSLAQSWATISGVDTDEHKEKAIRSGLSELTDNGIIRLISPALKDSSFDPGYIKDYPPGVRENGSQYNHAALWMAQALFIRGDSDGGKAILDMVNPYARTKTKSDLDIYRGEPYAVASDIYASPAPHGRAGWTWYTGAAGVMLKVVLESMFGLQIKGDSVSFAPHLPTSWSESTVIWRQETGQYTFRFKRGDIFGNQVISKSLDGKIIEGDSVPLTKDGKNHEIVITIGA
jgi:cyclic beta-1,2-glucan synthetase